MDIKAVKFRKDGFYSQPFVFGGEEGQEKFDKNIRYRGSLQNYLIDTIPVCQQASPMVHQRRRRPSISVRASANIWMPWLYWATSQSRLQRYC